MPRLPRNVPVSKPAETFDGKPQIYASLVFACTSCWDSGSWGFIAYNSNGQTYQVRKCLGEYCYYTNDGKGKWITQDEQHEKTKYQIEGDFE
jgi:hypothetical protein